jgi:TrmH family RNA methyltransferase
MFINSLTNPLVKHLIKLRDDSKYRKEQKEVLVMGKKMVKEVAIRHTPKVVIATNSVLISDINASSILMTTDDVMKKICGMPTPEGIVAIFPLPAITSFTNQGRHFLLLDGLKDPGNVGTLIRTAYALNFDGVILTDNTVDPFNDKALRAAKGTTFFLSLFHLDDPKKLEHFNIYIADAGGKDVKAINFKEPMVLVLGSESHGSKFSLGEKVSIPMAHDFDSLNVSIAGAILMYLMNAAS